MKNTNLVSGFTILELSIVIIVIAILSTLTLAALGPIRETNRNTKRVTDIKSMQQALKMYYRDYGIYPSVVTPGSALVSGSNTYLTTWPQNPSPRNDGTCPDADYSYTSVNSGVSYSIAFCLSGSTAEIGVGTSYAIPDLIATCVPDCTRSCSPGSDGCGGTCNNSAACAVGVETCYASHCIKN